MKLIFLSDAHLTSSQTIGRTDNVLYASIEKITYIVNLARKLGADLFCSGDFFDRPRDWLLLPPLIEILIPKKGRPPVHLFAVYGQHDMYKRNPAGTSLGVLVSAGLATILDETPRYYPGFTLYGCSWGQDVPTPENISAKNILLIHAPIALKEAYPDHQYEDAHKFLTKNLYYSIIACGDVHRKWYLTTGTRHIFNTGPLMRLEATDYNMRHRPCVAIYDTDNNKTIELHEIPCEPGAVALTRKHIENEQANKQILADFVEKMKTPTYKKGMTMPERLLAWTKENEIAEPAVANLLKEVARI